MLDGIGEEWEVIFSVDPSPDRTEEVIAALSDADPRIKMLRFSRRFGQPMATLAGMDAASGDAVVVIDCDLQDPPELIPDLVARWREGYDVVYAQRTNARRGRRSSSARSRCLATSSSPGSLRSRFLAIPGTSGS